MIDWTDYVIVARRTWEYGGIIEVGPKSTEKKRILQFGMAAECSFTLPNNFHGEHSEVEVSQGSVGSVDLETGARRCESYRLSILIGKIVEYFIEHTFSVESIVEFFDEKNPVDVLTSEVLIDAFFLDGVNVNA